MYHIYENWRAGPHKVVLHHGTCGYCNHGTGMNGGTRPDNGKWHGPFDTIERARSALQSIQDPTARTECRCITKYPQPRAR